MSEPGLVFARGPASDEAKDLWASHLGFSQGRLERSAGLGGERLPTAPPLPKLGGPEDPGRMVKDWNFYKYRPHANMSSSLNRYGPDFRWPGLNNTPEIRHHLALVKRPKPTLPLNPHIWTDCPGWSPAQGWTTSRSVRAISRSTCSASRAFATIMPPRARCCSAEPRSEKRFS